MERDPIRTDSRIARRARRLGQNMACVLCGVTDPPALVRVNRPLLEAHHVAGRANDGALTVAVCRNCHAVLTEGQLAGGVDLRPRADRATPEAVAAALDGLSAFFAALSLSLARWADLLRADLAASGGRPPE